MVTVKSKRHIFLCLIDEEHANSTDEEEHTFIHACFSS